MSNFKTVVQRYGYYFFYYIQWLHLQKTAKTKLLSRGWGHGLLDLEIYVYNI